MKLDRASILGVIGLVLSLSSGSYAEDFPINTRSDAFRKNFEKGMVLPIWMDHIRHYKTVTEMDSEPGSYFTIVEQGRALLEIRNATEWDCINQQKKALKDAENRLGLTHEILKAQSKYLIKGVSFSFRDYSNSDGQKDEKDITLIGDVGVMDYPTGNMIPNLNEVVLMFGLIKNIKNGKLECKTLSSVEIEKFLKAKLTLSVGDGAKSPLPGDAQGSN